MGHDFTPEQKARISKGRNNVWGKDLVRNEKSLLSSEQAFFDIVDSLAYEHVWSRDNLPLKTRRLVTIGILATLSRIDQFKTHVAAALDAGVTPDEICEALIQVLGYAGMPTSVAAMLAFQEVAIAKGHRQPDE